MTTMSLKILIIFVPLVLSIKSLAQPLASDDQIAWAKKAAPENITDKASYLALEKNSNSGLWEYVKKIQGDNNFTCLLLTDPQGRFEPSCLNEQAMKTVFPVYQFQTQSLYAGISIQDIDNSILEMVNKGKLPKPTHGELVYMMSNDNKWYDHVEKVMTFPPPHLMFFQESMDDGIYNLSDSVSLVKLSHPYPHLSVLIIQLKN